MSPLPVKLFCLPCARASATMYLRWRRLLPAWIEIVPLELPGRGSRMTEPVLREFDVLSALLCQELLPGLTGPYALFGHSMGALLAYDVVNKLRENKAKMPEALFVSACAAPSGRTDEHFPGEKDTPLLIADLHKHGGTPGELFSDAELLRMTVNLLGADYRICESFQHYNLPPLPVPISVFAGKDDDIEEQRLAAWKYESTMGITLDWFDGGHFFIRQNEASLLNIIVTRLKRERLLSLNREILCA